MAAEKYVIALDQGTTSSRAVLINREGRMVDCVQRPFQQIFPKPGWVEHNPQDILYSQLGSLTELLAKRGLTAEDIDSIGIDNQRETTIVWDPTYRAARLQRHRLAVPPHGRPSWSSSAARLRRVR
jgi:glycerol kinase